MSLPAPPVISAVRMTGAGRTERPLLVLGPSLGASAMELWSACAAAGLTEAFDVLAWDLPGHGHNRSVPEEPFTLADLARGVLAVVDDVLAQRDELGGPFAYAGTSLGGAVGLQLLVDAPGRVASAVLLGTSATGGPEPAWDLRDRLGEVTRPVLASVRALADGVPDGRLLELDGAAELAPTERPAEVAALIRRHVLGDGADPEAAGLDLRGRLLVGLAALAAGRRDAELAAMVREAARAGLSAPEVRAALREVGTHLGAPVAEAALRVAEQALGKG